MACQGSQDQVESLEDQSADWVEGSNREKEAAGIAEAVAAAVE